MDFDFSVKLFSGVYWNSFTAILGNGAVANVRIKRNKGHQSGWLVIAIGYGWGVMIPALMFGNVSGNHINPALPLDLQLADSSHGQMFYHTSLPNSWSYVWTIGCRCSSPSILHQTENPNNILGTFSTISSLE